MTPNSLERQPSMQLEILSLPRDTLHECRHLFFSARTLPTAITNGCSADDIRAYLQHYDRKIVEQHISDQVDGCHNSPATHAAKRNAFAVTEILLEYGADANAKDSAGISLLASTIMWTQWTFENVDRLVALLLSYGADTRHVPEDMWSIYIQAPKKYSSEAESAAWITKEHRICLAGILNLTIRYLLNRASQIQPATKRQWQVANLYGCPRLLRLPYQLPSPQ